MIDPGNRKRDTSVKFWESVPPLWKSSMALFRYTPPEEYQIYPNQRIIYYKLSCTITNYQLKSNEILGAIDADGFTGSYIPGDVYEQLVKTSLSCTGAAVQIFVEPKEKNRSPESYPYFIEMQPRQRVLYTQITDATELSSRSLENLKIGKDGVSGKSIEVIDIDKGGSGNLSIGGVGGGVSHAMEAGSKILGKEENTNTSTTDTSRELRETVSHTTQLSQMHTLLQSYHIGTNRIFFFITPRPYTEDPPNGLSGPRELDGIQDFFFVVCQPKNDSLPCISIRLDTAHLHKEDDMTFDESQPSHLEVLDYPAPVPTTVMDPGITRTSEGESLFYNCYDLISIHSPIEVKAPTGYKIKAVKSDPAQEITTPGGDYQVLYAADGRQVTITSSASGHVCLINDAGKLANEAILGIGYHLGGRIWSDIADGSIRPGRVRRVIAVSFISELPIKKKGEIFTLTFTTRYMDCCNNADSGPPEITHIVPWSGDDIVFQDRKVHFTNTNYAIPLGINANDTLQPGAGITTTTTISKGISRDQANDMQKWAAEELHKYAINSSEPNSSVSYDNQLILRKIVNTSLQNPLLRKNLTKSADTLEIPDNVIARLSKKIGRDKQSMTCLDILSLPDSLLKETLGSSSENLLKLRLNAAGIPTMANKPKNNNKSNPKRSPKQSNRHNKQSRN